MSGGLDGAAVGLAPRCGKRLSEFLTRSGCLPVRHRSLGSADAFLPAFVAGLQVVHAFTNTSLGITLRIPPFAHQANPFGGS